MPDADEQGPGGAKGEGMIDTVADTEIERLDRALLRNVGLHLMFCGSSVALILVRFFFRAYGLNQLPIGMVVLAALIITMLAQAVCLLGQVRRWRTLSRDPRLSAALNNEMLQTLGAQAWMGAYIGAAASVVFFAIVSSFYPVRDPVTIALTTILVGYGAQRATFYFKYRSA